MLRHVVIGVSALPIKKGEQNHPAGYRLLALSGSRALGKEQLDGRTPYKRKGDKMTTGKTIEQIIDEALKILELRVKTVQDVRRLVCLAQELEERLQERETK